MLPRPVLLSCVLLGCALATHTGQAQSAREPGLGAPEIHSAASPSALLNRPVVQVRIVNPWGLWSHRERLERVRIGEPLKTETARRAMAELLGTGRYASANAQAFPSGEGVILELIVTPRRIVRELRVNSIPFNPEALRRAAGTREGAELTPADLDSIKGRVEAWLGERGYPDAHAQVGTLETDEPLRVVVSLAIELGPAARISRRVFAVRPFPALREASHLLQRYALDMGDRADEKRLADADRELEERLQDAGFHAARVSHRLDARDGNELTVTTYTGPLDVLRFDGVESFDRDELAKRLAAESMAEDGPNALAKRLEKYYVDRGWLDAVVRGQRSTSPDGRVRTLSFRVREQQPVRVVSRTFPCLDQAQSVGRISSEIDGFLDEALPSSPLLSAVDSGDLGDLLGGERVRSERARPLRPTPYATYQPEVYRKASQHLQQLFRSEGWVGAVVDEPTLVRRRCRPGTQAQSCAPEGPDVSPEATCRYDGLGLPRDEPVPLAAKSCQPDPQRGVNCSPHARVAIPIRLGPRASLYDVAFDGNRTFTDEALLELSEIELGGPAQQSVLETARRAIADHYAEHGFAFATVESHLDLSPDHTRARARFAIRERQRVAVAAILVRGAHRTNEGLIRRRIALRVTGPYRKSLVRATEERLATLGVFASVTVGFEDPYVPAREKVVVVEVVERPPQYLDVRPGFSTGEGFRVAFEYGHRNLAAEAIALTLRVQLGYLPTLFILEEDVRRKYAALDYDQRLERRNTARVEFPEVGMGPLFPLTLEGVDVRDNARDFGLTKDAGLLTLSYRPNRRFRAYIGTSIERNDAAIFGSEQKGALQQYVQDNPARRSTFRVPEGTTLALAERAGFAWDRRNNPLGATHGTFVAASVEHVRADPIAAAAAPEAVDPSTDLFAATPSQFLRFTQRLAGYLPLGDHGAALAASFAWGYNHQLRPGSRTYPDRLFFLGGADSLRGFLQDALVPEDVAQQLMDDSAELTLRQVVIRGGNVFINPRLEARIPLRGSLQTALFLDTGNLWTALDRIDRLRLRYAAGTGLRVSTPVGPLAFDYGFNLERVLDELRGRRGGRYWEALGAFHFSIGLF